MAVFDAKKSSELSERQSEVLIEILKLQARLRDMQQEAIFPKIL